MYVQSQKVGEMTLVYAIKINKVQFLVDNPRIWEINYIQQITSKRHSRIDSVLVNVLATIAECMSLVRAPMESNHLYLLLIR